jgi:hypothetical protein
MKENASQPEVLQICVDVALTVMQLVHTTVIQHSILAYVNKREPDWIAALFTCWVTDQLYHEHLTEPAVANQRVHHEGGQSRP